MAIITQKMRKIAINEEFDYPFLMSCLRDYQKPHDKITHMLKDSEIVRVKKGLYIFGPDFSKSPYCKEALANLIYGPSYISLESALAFYHMIPERVETITSITTQRNKIFQTSVGLFTYQHLQKSLYAVGVTSLNLDSTHAILIATKEKALADLLYFKKLKSIKTKKDLRVFLDENIRLEMSCLKTLHKTRLKKIAHVYKNPVIDLLLEIVL